MTNTNNKPIKKSIKETITKITESVIEGAKLQKDIIFTNITKFHFPCGEILDEGGISLDTIYEDVPCEFLMAFVNFCNDKIAYLIPYYGIENNDGKSDFSKEAYNKAIKDYENDYRTELNKYDDIVMFAKSEGKNPAYWFFWFHMSGYCNMGRLRQEHFDSFEDFILKYQEYFLNTFNDQDRPKNEVFIHRFTPNGMMYL